MNIRFSTIIVTGNLFKNCGTHSCWMFALESKLQVTRYKYNIISINDNKVNQIAQGWVQHYGTVFLLEHISPQWSFGILQITTSSKQDGVKTMYEHRLKQKRQVYFYIATAKYKIIWVSPQWTIRLSMFKFQNRFFDCSIANSLGQIRYTTFGHAVRYTFPQSFEFRGWCGDTFK